jgi:hypothetical protein
MHFKAFPTICYPNKVTPLQFRGKIMRNTNFNSSEYSRLHKLALREASHLRSDMIRAAWARVGKEIIQLNFKAAAPPIQSSNGSASCQS